MRKALLILGLGALLAALALGQRHRLLLWYVGGEPPPLLEAAEEGPGVSWADDYFLVRVIDAQTFAIGEPRYHQQNVNYLVAGEGRAVLFDAGAGYRDIRPVAEALTDRPITFVPSHFHFDHVGNTVRFDRVAVVDLPHLRERARNGVLQLEWYEHLGGAEGVEAPRLEIDEWLAPNSVIDLGGRSLRVLYTPGHTDDSISLLDEQAGYLFAGDFIYPGPLYGFLPNSRLGDYQQGAETLLDSTAEARVFGAHRDGPPGIPELSLRDVSDLGAALRAIREGRLESEGVYPVTYRVNERLELLAEPGWLQDWERRYPGLAPGSR